MKSYKGNMLLIELVITILFFSLSQVVIMQVFITAQQKSSSSRIMHLALQQAQDVAEQLSCETEPDMALLRLGFMGGNGNYFLSNTTGFDLYVSLTHLEQPAGYLMTAQLTAKKDGMELFTFPCTYYAAKEEQP